DEAESSERNQRDPPRLVPKVHIVSDDEATFDCRGRHQDRDDFDVGQGKAVEDRKSTRLNSSHVSISYAVFCLKKKTSELQSRFDLVCRLLLVKKYAAIMLAPGWLSLIDARSQLLPLLLPEYQLLLLLLLLELS